MIMEIPQWFSITIASIVPALGIIGFWMTISARLTKAESSAESAHRDACDIKERLTDISQSYTAFREAVAKEYIHRATMIEVEDRLTQSIDRLGDRFDRFLNKLIDEKEP